MNSTNVDDSSGLGSSELTLIGITVSVILQILVCSERIFSRVQKSSCRRDATGAVTVEMESKEHP